jgi:isopentenyl-diphosphate Delta-isomerase
MDNYYKEKQFLPQVDNQDKVVGKVEKWQAHKENILHRGFTVILVYQNNIILQQRKHLAFDGLYDLSFSSHAIYVNEKLQTDDEAISNALNREWNLNKEDLLSPPQFKGKFYYQAKDSKSDFSEHEFDYIYQVELKRLPQFNPEFAYGIKLIPKNIENWKLEIENLSLCPWAQKIIDGNLYNK